MKKIIRVLIPIILVIAIILSTAWYLFIYDLAFTRDMLLSFARFNESQGNHTIATWLYNQAYSQTGHSDDVAIELAEQYKKIGNYTKAEFTLTNAISDGGSIELYIALCKTYVEQDKLLDAVKMLNNVTDPEIQKQLETLRPAAPLPQAEPGFYNQYISVGLESTEKLIYATNTGEYPSIKNVYKDPLPLGDGENQILAIAVSENGLVSPVGIYGYTVGGVIEKLEFTDSAMEDLIRTTLNVSEATELYTNDLWVIKSFTVPAEAKDYSVLKNMIYLEELTVENGAAGQLIHLASASSLRSLTVSHTTVSQEELEVIGTLPVLESLTLKSAGISTVAPLRSATSLKNLVLTENSIRNIDALKELTKLEELRLDNNALTDVTALASLATLKVLDLGSNNITSIAPLSGLTSLTYLNASSNLITDIGELGKLTALTELSLASNKLNSVSTIAGCTELTNLDISANELTKITELSVLNKVTYFNFSNNKVTAIPEFAKDCKLVTIIGSQNEISTLEPLAGLPNLNVVDMDYNKEINSVAPLKDCPVLIRVNVFATKVTEVTVLTDQSIEVNFNPVQ
ncbi:MAG: leucine-rich repeat domain-containing protein [Oscillospiraceae bacterium]|nr:leucine-rich repeat domain-containing protein [Oscillospiraceae bacterium]